jgi:DNA-binding IclR family transcriptional regulator
MVDESQYVIQSLDVALDVLEYLADTRARSLRISEIARALGISRTRVFRVLKTLEHRHYVRSDPETSGYRLGLKCLKISEQVRAQTDVRREAEPFLLELAKKSGDTAVLVVLDGDKAVDIASYQGDHVLQAAVRIGERHPLHIGASNKILLAHLPPQEQERIIQQAEFVRYTDKTITCPDKLRQCLAQIREDGYAVDEESFELGVYAIGAPVYDHANRVVAGISVTTPRTRYDPERRKRLIALTAEAARKISERLG